MPGWRNGYTRTTQNRVEKSVEVRLLFPAQLKKFSTDALRCGGVDLVVSATKTGTTS